MSLNKNLTKPRYLQFCFLLCYFIFELLLVNRHEMWLDETQPWLLARDSNSYPELLFNKRYDGHPALWYTIVYVVTHFTSNVKAIQVLNVIFISLFVYLFLKSNFHIIFKFLFCLGYYILYEYAIITRLYAVELLLAGLACHLYQRNNKASVTLFLTLYLLAQTNLFGMIFSAGFLFLLFYEQYFVFKEKYSFKKALGFCAVLVGFGLSIYSIIPPPDEYFAAGWNFFWNFNLLKDTLAAIWHGFVPFPSLYVEFWNTNIVRSGNYRAILGICLYVLTFTFFLKSPKILILYAFVTFSALLFFYLKYSGTTRHQGHLFLYFVFCLWLLPAQQNPFSRYFSNVSFSPKVLGIYLLLIINCGAGIFAAAVDWVYPFSPNKQTAAFLETIPYPYNLVSENGFHPSTISAYLNKKIFYANTQRLGSFYQTSYKEKKKISAEKTIQTGIELTNRTNRPTIVILEEELTRKPQNMNRVEKIFKSDNSILGKPVYHLYLIQLNK